MRRRMRHRACRIAKFLCKLANNRGPLTREHTPYGRSCFAPWEDVGPSGEDDFAFVFGDPDVSRNTFDA